MVKEYAKMDSGSLHLANKKVILSLIKLNRQISRSDLAKATGLTPPTVTRIVDELVYSNKLAEYIGTGDSSGGRPPVIVKFNNESNYIIGIDLGATYIRGCLVDLNAKFIYEIQLPTEIDKGFESIIEKVIQLINKIRSRNENGSRIWGIGIGVAGLVDRETGIIEFSPDFGWSNIDMRKKLKDQLDLPFFYDNSTRLMALGELKLGSRPDIKNFAIINFGYGIAAGLVVNGKVVKGHSGFAGEFGHISIDKESGVKCQCGMNGCLEALASGHRIAELGRNELTGYNSEMLKNLCYGNPKLVTAELIAKAAKMGDLASLRIFDEVTEYLCKGIGVIANLLNPERIYLGGGVSLNGQFLYDMINKKKSEYLLSSNSKLPILPSTFGERATTIGAVSLVLEKILNLEL